MRHYTVKNGDGLVIATISRSDKCDLLFEIHYPQAEADINWQTNSRVPYRDAKLFLYVLKGIEECKSFDEWIDSLEVS